MTDLHAAAELVDGALDTGQIGTPVAVRIVAHLEATGATSVSLSESAVQMASRWLNDQPMRVVSAISASGRHETKLVLFANGKTALLSTGICEPNAAALQISVFGNHGIASWQGESGQTPMAIVATSSRGYAPSRTAQKPPYGVLLVAGDHTHQPMYAGVFASDPRCRLIGLTDAADITSRRRQLNEQFADALGIPLLPDMDAALVRDDVHIVSVCAEPIRRGRIIVRAARAGKHVYLDKPLAGSLADADSVVTAVRDAGVFAHMFSSVPTQSVGRLRRIVDSGQLGKFVAVHTDLCFAKGLAGTATLAGPRTESSAPQRYEVPEAKREMTNVGVYALVALLSVLRRRVVRVAATTGNYFFAEHQANDMEDFAQLLLEFEDGLVATCTTGRTGWQSHPREGVNRTLLIGTQASAVVDAYGSRVEVWSDAASWSPPPRNPDDPMGMWVAAEGNPYRASPKMSWLTTPWLSPVTDVTYFLDCLERGRESDVPASLAADATEILLAAYRSAATGQQVSLPLPR
ncbi:MAG: Gfo/Idh/MocA family oxidoreductase [Planctomycetes bacterium]|nr:Gfo/Idh/MocA family oxidoreductase [Planctomycetota bacterium]MBL7042328.1 Gfo/Idh/MocA family oxidoreductase [Pirellulaceae bacterium]